MSTCTAQILVGHGHPNHGGIIPSHILQLTENSRPCWTLWKISPDKQGNCSEEPMAIWIPTVDSMLEDGLAMICTYILRDAGAMARIGGFERRSQGMGPLRVEMGEMDDDGHTDLIKHCRTLTPNAKIVLTLLEDSHLLQPGQIDSLKHYAWDMEVCPVRYRRAYSQWSEKVETAGSLEDCIGGPKRPESGE